MVFTPPDPIQPGDFIVYVMWGRFGHALYVGQSIDAGGRFRKHRHDKAWWRLVQRIELRHCEDKAEMTNLERTLIEQHRPPFNVALNRRAEPPPHWSKCDECGRVLEWRELKAWQARFNHGEYSFSGSWFCSKCQDYDNSVEPPEWAAHEALEQSEVAELRERREAANAEMVRRVLERVAGW